MGLFGATASDQKQQPQMIKRIELLMIDTEEKFFVDMFPNELPDFLILFQVFNS